MTDSSTAVAAAVGGVGAMSVSQALLSSGAENASTAAKVIGGMIVLYDRWQRGKEKMDGDEQDLLAKVSVAHARCGCSRPGAPPREFRIDPDTDRPELIDPNAIRVAYDPEKVQISMRVELIELTDLLAVLGDVDNERSGKPCALWQVLLEMHTWMATELPRLLDSAREAPEWDARLKNRITYLKQLDFLDGLDPDVRAGIVSRWTASADVKQRRERRFTRVAHTLREHLDSIRKDHLKVMAERSSAQLLESLEHSIKGVVRPCMQAAMICLVNHETSDGMVFSELASGEDRKWSWMKGFKDQQLCQLLSAQIKLDPLLQKCLHVVNYQGDGSTPSPAALQVATRQKQYVERVAKDCDQLVRELLADPKGTIQRELPQTSKAHAHGFAQSFRGPLVKLLTVNITLAKRVGEGVKALRETQVLAKKLGQIMFAKECAQQVQNFLSELVRLVEEMVALVGEVQEEMDTKRSSMVQMLDIPKEVMKKNQPWQTNVNTAGFTIEVANANMTAVQKTRDAIMEELQKNEASAPLPKALVDQWIKVIAGFSGTAPVIPEGVPSPVAPAQPALRYQRAGLLVPAREVMVPWVEEISLGEPRHKENVRSEQQYTLFSVNCSTEDGKSSWVCLAKYEEMKNLAGQCGCSAPPAEPPSLAMYTPRAAGSQDDGGAGAMLSLREAAIVKLLRDEGEKSWVETHPDQPGVCQTGFVWTDQCKRIPSRPPLALERWMQRLVHFHGADAAVQEFLAPVTQGVWEYADVLTYGPKGLGYAIARHPDEAMERQSSQVSWAPYSDDITQRLETGYMTGIRVEYAVTSSDHGKPTHYVDLSQAAEDLAAGDLRLTVLGYQGATSEDALYKQYSLANEQNWRIVRRRTIGVCCNSSRTTAPATVDFEPEPEVEYQTVQADGAHADARMPKSKPSAALAVDRADLTPSSSDAANLRQSISRVSISPSSAHNGKYPCRARVLQKCSVRQLPSKDSQVFFTLRKHTMVDVQEETLGEGFKPESSTLVKVQQCDAAGNLVVQGWVKRKSEGYWGSDILTLFPP